jgi:hypothetical protein
MSNLLALLRLKITDSRRLLPQAGPFLIPPVGRDCALTVLASGKLPQDRQPGPRAWPLRDFALSLQALKNGPACATRRRRRELPQTVSRNWSALAPKLTTKNSPDYQAQTTYCKLQSASLKPSKSRGDDKAQNMQHVRRIAAEKIGAETGP